MSFKATLAVQGEEFNVRRFDWEVSQRTDALNRPDATVQGGQLRVELDSRPSDLLHFWALDDTKQFSGELRVTEATGDSVRKTIEFKDAYCVGLSKRFDGSGSTQSMIMTLSLSADKLVCGEMTIHNDWPR
jgi:hypothetical protein